MPRKIAPLSFALEDILKVLGENIKLARLRRKITTTMLAERAGMGRITLRKVEQGNSGVPSAPTPASFFVLDLRKICC